MSVESVPSRLKSSYRLVFPKNAITNVNALYAAYCSNFVAGPENARQIRGENTNVGVKNASSEKAGPPRKAAN